MSVLPESTKSTIICPKDLRDPYSSACYVLLSNLSTLTEECIFTCIFFHFCTTVLYFHSVKVNLDLFLCVGRTMVINVEYNQLDPLLRATGHPDGDANCETGYSPYPGNINQVILHIDMLEQ